MYNVIEYWNNRIDNHGSVNTSNESVAGINQIESEIIRKYITDNSKVILDFGIGAGRLIPLYYAMNLQVQGYDIADFKSLIDEKLIKYPLKYWHFINDNIFNTKYINKNFPYTVAFAVLPHQLPSDIERVLIELFS